MAIMILGIVLWWASHLFPIYLPAGRAAAVARLGVGPYRGLFALVSLVAMALIVIGYRRADFVNVWYPPAWTLHLNNLLMVVAVFLVEARRFNSFARRYVRHPMLTSVMLWAFAHLLVNGDAASVLLFSSMLAWAVVAIAGSNARDGAWARPPAGDRRGLLVHLGATVVVFVVIVAIHWGVFGLNPFPQ